MSDQMSVTLTIVTSTITSTMYLTLNYAEREMNKENNFFLIQLLR